MSLFSRKLRKGINRCFKKNTNNVLIYTSSVHEMKFENRIFWISFFVRIVRSRLSIFNTCNNLMLKEVVQKELSRSYVLIQTKNHYICMYTLYITLSHKLSDSYGRSFIHWWRILTIFNLLKKVENILKGSLDSISSPSVKIQIMGRKVCLRCIRQNIAGRCQQTFE